MKYLMLSSVALSAMASFAAVPVAPVADNGLPVTNTALNEARVPFRLGVAGYTFCKRNLDDTLKIMKNADVHYLCVKDFHLKYTATDAEIAAFKQKCATNGVIPYALGPLYTKNNDEVLAYFEFAKRFGAKVIVGVPYDPPAGGKDKWNQRKGSRKQLEYIDKLVKDFDIKYAIHNHGPASPEMYPDVAYGWNLIKDLDKRIGFCLDIGWEYGSGRDPVATIRKYADRIFDVHVKNFKIDAPDGYGVPLARGKIDYVKVFKALTEVGYSGVCALEYERNFEDNAALVSESIGYARGVCQTLQVKARMMPVPEGANTLTVEEKSEGYELLFDGKTLPTKLWIGEKEKFQCFPKKGWYAEAGALYMKPVSGIAPNGKWFPLPPEDARLGGGGSIVTVKKYKDFIFKFDFRLTEAANSGIKYYYDETVNNKGTCEEYQVLDPGHPDYDKPNASGVEGTHRIGALYDLAAAPLAEKFIKPTGHWNSGMIVAKGNHIEHWLNGVKILEYERGSEQFRKWVDVSKYAKWGNDAAGNPQRWGEVPVGRIHIQDHSDSCVYYCNLKIKEL